MVSVGPATTRLISRFYFSFALRTYDCTEPVLSARAAHEKDQFEVDPLGFIRLDLSLPAP
jgi:hypothetical protein